MVSLASPMAGIIQKKLGEFSLEPLVEEYVTIVALGVLEEGGKSKHLKAAMEPILADTSIDSSKLMDMCQGIFQACFPEDTGEADDENKDFLVECRDIILAYAGKQLLKPTHLLLERNHRYGVVGNNGVGKTTLLNRIASREVANFPQGIKVLYIQHEVYVDLDVTVTEFMEMQQKDDASTDVKAIKDALASIGFTQERMDSPVSELSGGWRMKLAIATAVTQKCDLLLLDEPTNHLDAGSRAWLADYLVTLKNTTVCIVSHDYEFLGKVCGDVLHIANLRLSYFGGGFQNFAESRPDVMEALPTMTESGASAVLNLPDPGKLEGVKSRTKPVVEIKNLTFFYPGAEQPTFEGVSAKMCIKSRVGLLGANGAGKTTLLRQIVGDLLVDQGTGKHQGEIVKHQNLRMAYISQSSMHHLEEFLHKKPWEYIQERFRTGLDKELAKRETMKLTEEDDKLRTKLGNISEVVGRAIRGGELSYEFNRWGRENEGTFWEPLGSLKRKDPYVMKLCLNYDAKLQAYQSGAEIRPCTQAEILKHLAEFGISHRLAQSGRIKGMSGGQKCRLVLASAVWNKPHFIALDEPTNYLDNETLNALSSALRRFEGGILVISHHATFINDTCTELWKVEDKKVTVMQTAKEGRTMQRGGSSSSLSRGGSSGSLDSMGSGSGGD
jgi:elongation factor 3